VRWQLTLLENPQKVVLLPSFIFAMLGAAILVADVVAVSLEFLLLCKLVKSVGKLKRENNLLRQVKFFNTLASLLINFSRSLEHYYSFNFIQLVEVKFKHGVVPRTSTSTHTIISLIFAEH